MALDGAKAAGPSKKAASRAASKAAMKDAAIVLIAEGGVPSVTLAKLGAKAGRSRGLASHYFDSKAELLNEVIDDLLQEPKHGGERGFELMLRTVANTLKMTLDDPVRARARYALLGEVQEGASHVERLRLHHQRSAQAIEAHLAAGKASNEVRADIDPAGQALIILATLRGALFLALARTPGMNLEAFAEQFVDNLRRALTAERQPAG